MKQLFSAYPAGLAGVALLLFRCSLALFIATTATEILPLRHWSAFILDILAVALAAGFATRTIAALGATAGCIASLSGTCAMPILLLTHVLDAVALAMIGPGAFAIDARLFGRATIHLPH
jgi:putative oxidoreductase